MNGMIDLRAVAVATQINLGNRHLVDFDYMIDSRVNIDYKPPYEDARTIDAEQAYAMLSPLIEEHRGES